MNRSQRQKRQEIEKYLSCQLTRRNVFSGELCTISEQWDSIRKAADIRETLHNQKIIDFATTDGDAIAAEIRRYYNDGK
jgi:hypothetical protein